MMETHAAARNTIFIMFSLYFRISLYLFLYLFYVSPVGDFSCEDLFDLIHSQVFYIIVFVYDYCDSVQCDFLTLQTLAGLFIFQLSGCHTDVTYAFCRALDAGAGSSLLDFDSNATVEFFVLVS